MEDRGAAIRNAIIIVLALVVAGAVVFMLYQNNQQEKEYAATVEALREEAKPYEEELKQLESELDDLENGITYSSEEAEIMVGYVVSDVSDMSYIAGQAKTYGFEPVVIIDCTMEMTDIEAILQAVDANWEIMLYASDFSTETNDSVLSVMTYLETRNREHTGVFFLRDDFSDEENIQLVLDDGFMGYTQYHNAAPEAGQAEDGSVYFDYSYVRQSGTSISSRLSAFYNNKASMLVALDMENINSGALKEEDVANLFDMLTEYAENDDCSFSTVADAVEELSQISTTEEERQAEYEKREAELQERMDELEETIHDIYSQISS